jgi:hypothetical protein
MYMSPCAKTAAFFDEKLADRLVSEFFLLVFNGSISASCVIALQVLWVHVSATAVQQCSSAVFFGFFSVQSCMTWVLICYEGSGMISRQGVHVCA